MIKKYALLVVLLLVYILQAQSQNYSVSGSVMTEQGETLTGVYIMVKGSTDKATTSDIEGNFVMENIPSGSTLVFSYIGFETQELVVTSDRRQQRIALKELIGELDEVVVVGRGTQRRISISGAIANVDVADLQIPATSITNMIGGRIPGIISVTRSGEPGNDYSEFWVRGISTFGAGGSALILIDGVEGDLNTLDPADIESFSVLKDASATAVYGMRGANGVVVVTTRRGNAGRLSIDYKGNMNMSYSPRMPEYVRAAEYARLANEATAVRNEKSPYNQSALALFATGLDPDLFPDVDWREAILKKRVWTTQHHLSVNGGGTLARYYMSLGYLDKEAIYNQDPDANQYQTKVGYQKYNFRANVDVNLTKSTTLELGLETIYERNIFPGYGDNTNALWQAQANLTPVTVPIIYSNGLLPAYGRNYNEQSPYVLMNHTGYNKTFRNGNIVRVRLTQHFDRWVKGLSGEALFNLNANSFLRQWQQKTPALYYASGRDRQGELIMSQRVAKADDVYTSLNETNRKIYFETRLNWNRIFANHHRVTGLINYYMEDYITGTATSLSASIPVRYIGLAGRATYAYKDTYFIEVNLGYSGSEAFEKGSKFGFFPAISGGWVPTQYNWVKNNLRFVDYFKIRASYGIIGNDRISNNVRFPYLTLMVDNAGSGPWNSGTGIRESQVGSENLRWEKSIKTNVGLDAKIFQDRIDLTVDFFRDIRSGIYQQRASVPEEIGLVTLPFANVGEMESWGSDGNIAYTQRIGSESHLMIRANYTFSRNEIKEYEESGIRYPYQSRIGYQNGVMRGLIAIGLFEDEADIASSPRQTYMTNYMPGDIKYKDVNGDGRIDDDDRVALKYSNVPRLQYGAALEYRWKKLTVSAFVEAVGNVSFFYGGTGFYPFSQGETGNVLQIVADDNNRWIPASYSGDPATENPNARFPRLTYGDNANNNRESSFWLARGDYVRLKNVQISYRFEPEFFRIVGLKNATVSLIGDNLYVWDGVKLWDPTQASQNGAVYPLQRVYTLQLNLKF